MPASHASCTASAPEPTPCWSHGGPSTVSIIGGSLVRPPGSMLPEKQLRGVELDSLARSPFVGFPKEPLFWSVFPVMRLPFASNRHTPPELIPPSQLAVMSVSGKSCVTIPHAPWFSTRLSWMVSNMPPEISMPAPTGASPEIPAAGTFGLLLSCTWLRRMIVHDPMPPGHCPFCGGGLSSLLSKFGTMPVLSCRPEGPPGRGPSVGRSAARHRARATPPYEGSGCAPVWGAGAVGMLATAGAGAV